jgi:hypothetical protein
MNSESNVLSDQRRGLNGAAIHLRAVYSLGFESPRFFAGADGDAMFPNGSRMTGIMI